MIDLRLGDCLEIMKSIPDKSIDLVLTDVPYGTTACKWDTVIPFEPMWKELKRIRKDNAAICLFGSEPFSSHLRMSNIKEFKYDWILVKNNPSNFANVKKMPMRGFELVSIFYKKQPTYNPQGVVNINKVKRNNGSKINKSGLKNNGEKTSNHNEFKFSKEYTQTQTNYPRGFIDFKKIGKSVHPTQKPVALLEYLIKTYTLGNETVLDFTMGSGSTGVACKNLNRNFIGIEMDKTYFEIAQKRIEGIK